jgi:hypothetical protein
MAISAEMAHHRARRARAVQQGDTEAAEVAARDLRAEKLAAHIRTVVDAMPPLTDEQRNRLAGLLGGA